MSLPKNEHCFGEKCNNRCVMCTNPEGPWYGEKTSPEEYYSLTGIVRRAKEKKEGFSDNEPIYITGGEPTVRPDFVEALRSLRDVFPRNEIRLFTNGRRFAYTDFTKDVLRCGRFRAIVSLCGPTAKIHDGITCVKGSFDQAITGLKNIYDLKTFNQFLEVRLVVTNLSYLSIVDSLKLVKRMFPLINTVSIIFMEIEGQAEKNIDRTLLTYSQFVPFFEEIKKFVNDFEEIRFYHFPLCAIDSDLWPHVWRTLPPNEVSFIETCQKCRYKKYCLGIHNKYLEHVGAKEFKPIRKVFNIEERGDSFQPIMSIK